jgi:hypothetical protein
MALQRLDPRPQDLTVNNDPPISLPDLIAQIKQDHPEIYRDLAHHYAEAILAIEQDGVTSFDDNTDNDVGEELWLLRADLLRLFGS